MSVFNILFICFWTFFIASATLEIIGYHKKIRLMEYICKPAMYVFLLAAALMILIPNIPDSINVILSVGLALLTGLTGACLQFLPKKRKTVLISSGLFVLSTLSYLYMLIPSFRLFSLHIGITIVIAIIYSGLFISYYIFMLGKRSVIKTAAICIFTVPMLIMHYGSILTLCGQPKLYSALIFTGCTAFLTSMAFVIKGFFKSSSEKERLIRMILYITGNFLIVSGLVIMVSFQA